MQRQSRTRRRFIRFIVCETIALVVLLVCAKAAASEALLKPDYNQLCTFLLILGAALTVLVPVLFYGVPGKFSRRLR